MNPSTFALIIFGVLLNALAQLLLKAGTNTLGVISIGNSSIFHLVLNILKEPHILGGLFCYVISVAVWILALSRVEVSTAYPLLSIGYIVNAIAAYYLFGESLDISKMTGIAFIIIGVIFITRS